MLHAISHAKQRQLSTLVLTLALALALVVIACGELAASHARAAQTRAVTIQLSWVHEAQFAGFYAAEAAGFYADEDLDVTLTAGGFDAEGNYIDPIAALLRGEADFAQASGEQLLTARAAGEPVVMIAAPLRYSPMAYISLAEKNIRRPQDFAGMRVANRPDLSVVYNALLDVAGISPDDFIEINDGTLFSVEALANDEIDVIAGFVVNEPITLENMGHDVNLVLLSDYGIESFHHILVTTEDMIANEPDVVRRFLRATLKGYAESLQDTDKYAELSLEYNPDLDIDHQRESAARMMPLVQPAGWEIGMIDVAAWQAFYDMLVAQDVVPDTVEADAAYTLDFLNDIYS